MRTLEIDWLGECEKCGCTDAVVTTERGSVDRLFSGDRLKCANCGNTGEVDTEGDCAWSLWDDE